MTEKEALTRWCPMVRLAWRNKDGSAITANRWGHGEPISDAVCIGSACMMFRTGKYTKGDGTDTLVDIVWCGLAGRP